MRTFLFLFLVSTCSAHAAVQWSFGDVSLNYLDWTSGTEKKSTKKDFLYLEIEGGSSHDWGELYGFFDLENPGKPAGDVRTAAKGSVRYYLFNPMISVYAHIYDFNAAGFAEQNRVVGLGLQFSGKTWWLKPFLGAHDVTQTFFNGYNGFMGGWIVGYTHVLLGQEFLLSDWHEWEFARDAAYATGQGGARSSINGAAAVTWIATKHLNASVQWRYATDKLGTPGTLGALISSIRYVF